MEVLSSKETHLEVPSYIPGTPWKLLKCPSTIYVSCFCGLGIYTMLEKKPVVSNLRKGRLGFCGAILLVITSCPQILKWL